MVMMGYRYCKDCRKIFRHTAHYICPRCGGNLYTESSLKYTIKRISKKHWTEKLPSDNIEFNELKCVLEKIKEMKRKVKSKK